jgi:hypothetical protein
MLNQNSKTVETKLELHRQLGTKSKLDIIEVAQLMDSLKNSGMSKQGQLNSIFFGIPMN